MAVTVVGRALLRVLQHLVGLGDFLEHLLRLLVAGVLVRVVLDRLLAVGLFELLLAGALGDAEEFVIVFFGHEGESRSIGAPHAGRAAAGCAPTLLRRPFRRAARHDHTGGAQQAAVERVAGTDHGQHVLGRDVGARLVRNRLVAMGVERLADRD
jgi:hypothetical protein